MHGMFRVDMLYESCKSSGCGVKLVGKEHGCK